MSAQTKFSSEQIEFISTHYTLYGAKFCADSLKIPYNSAAYLGEKLGLKVSKEVRSNYGRINASRPRPELCGVNAQSFIQCITPQHVYILGLIWADGHVYNKNGIYTISINLKATDGDVLFDTFMKTGKWSFHRTKSKGHTKEQLSFRTSNKELHAFLSSCGYLYKSTVDFNSIFNLIPEHWRHFWLRGFFDGDGCFFSSKTRCQYRFSFAGSYDQKWTTLCSILASLDIGYKISKRQHKTLKSRSSVVNCFSRDGVLKLGAYLYPENIYDDIGLKRKFEIYDMIKNTPNRYQNNNQNRLIL